ncbi:Copia protein [Bienertia sinuspersici]
MEEKEFGWTEFKKAIRDEFFPAHMRKRKRQEFNDLEQGDMNGLVPDEQERAVKFEEKLNPELHSRMGAGEYTTVKEVYTRACNAERIEEKRLAAKKLKSTPAGSAQVTDKGDTSGSNGHNKGKGAFNRNRNFRNRDSSGRFNKGEPNPRPKSKDRTNFLLQALQCEHPGKDCDGNPVDCNHCGKKGHRAYECFTNPRSKNFRPELSSRNGAQPDKRPQNTSNHSTSFTPRNATSTRDGGTANATQHY